MSFSLKLSEDPFWDMWCSRLWDISQSHPHALDKLQTENDTETILSFHRTFNWQLVDKTNENLLPKKNKYFPLAESPFIVMTYQERGKGHFMFQLLSCRLWTSKTFFFCPLTILGACQQLPRMNRFTPMLFFFEKCKKQGKSIFHEPRQILGKVGPNFQDRSLCDFFIWTCQQQEGEFFRLSSRFCK